MQKLEKPGIFPGRLHLLLLCLCAGLAWALFIHPDVLETANHSYIFLESLFSGNLRSFYQIVEQRPTSLYYVNGANYNIVVYLLYGIVQLPYYVYTKLASAPPNGDILQYFGKLVSLGFFLGCIPLVHSLAGRLGFNEEKASLAAMGFGLCVPVFFSSAVMGQYDVVCLFFLLLALRAALDKKMWLFVFWAGFGMAFKFFSFFAFIPLLLLLEKRVSRLLLYGLGSLWLLTPACLLFIGRNGGQGSFNILMLGRLLDASLPSGYGVSAFGVFFFILCVCCWLWRPQQVHRAMLWVCLAAYSLLLFFVQWHPQWVLLVSPFMLLTALQEKNSRLWLWLDAAFVLGFLGICAWVYPGHFSDRMLDLGFLGMASGVSTWTGENTLALEEWLAGLLPYFGQFSAVLFYGPLLFGLVAKFPLRGKSLGEALQSGEAGGQPANRPAGFWAVFAGGLGLWSAAVLVFWARRALDFAAQGIL